MRTSEVGEGSGFIHRLEFWDPCVQGKEERGGRRGGERGGRGGRRRRWDGTRGSLCFSLSLVSCRSLERRRLGTRITFTSARRGQRHLRPNSGLSPRSPITPDLFSTILVVTAFAWPSRFLGTCLLSLDIRGTWAASRNVKQPISWQDCPRFRSPVGPRGLDDRGPVLQRADLHLLPLLTSHRGPHALGVAPTPCE